MNADSYQSGIGGWHLLAWPNADRVLIALKYWRERAETAEREAQDAITEIRGLNTEIDQARAENRRLRDALRVLIDAADDDGSTVEWVDRNVHALERARAALAATEEPDD